MTQIAKKRREKWYLDLFKDLLRKKLREEFPLGNVLEQENPDFVIEHSMGRLGIEISEIVRSETVAAQAGFHDKLVRDARRVCEEWGVPPLRVKVWIDGPMTQVKGRVAQKQFAERLAKVVRDGYEGHAQDANGYFVLDDPLDGVWTIEVTHLKEPTIKSLAGHCWEWKPWGVVVSPLSVGEIQARIAEKNKRYERYRRYCDECWLVMVGDSYNPKMGSDISLDPSAVAHLYDSRFERVFYLQLYDVVTELKTRRSD